MLKCVCVKMKVYEYLLNEYMKQNQVITMREFVNLNISRSIMIDLGNDTY